MNDCLLIKIGGYEAIVDSKGLIIECHEKLNKIKHLILSDVFKKYQHLLKFEKIKEVPYPTIVAEDKYNLMVQKNPDLDLLRKKFECEIY